MFADSAFFAKTYREAFDLLRETRDYLAYCQTRDLAPRGAAERLCFSRESTRLTARLTDIMAWLFVQKAVAVGEMSADEAAEERHRLLRRDVCLDDTAATNDGLPRGLLSLLGRSHALYLRIARLDELMARAAA
ncbi:MAG TPA: DUF1465 family protein [Alphaproteobacteria bacterium]|nr:DUF1465 family protein [Alphaproteobacteria bacterium]